MNTLKSRGYILLFALVVFSILFTIGTGLANYVTSSVRLGHHVEVSDEALALAEGGLDKAVYQLNQSALYLGETDTPLGNGTFSTTVTVVDTNTRQISVTGYVPSRTNPLAKRTVTAVVSVDTTTIAFRYGLQIGDGGLSMSNGSKIIGNVFSNGPISGSGTVTGSATAASTATISGITVNGSASAHALDSCTILGSASFYGLTTTCLVSGSKNPGTADAAKLPMPISDTQITDWETTAAAGTVFVGSHTISSAETLGPAKITGDLIISNGASLTLSGPVWVTGDITFSNNSVLAISASTGSEGAVLIADKPGSTSTKGKVLLSNNMTISGNGNANSFPLLISTNTSGTAITLSNNAASVLLFAPYGTVSLSNGAGANQITAYAIQLSNNAIVTYLSGLQSIDFSDGPGGSWKIVPGSYGSL